MNGHINVVVPKNNKAAYIVKVPKLEYPLTDLFTISFTHIFDTEWVLYKKEQEAYLSRRSKKFGGFFYFCDRMIREHELTQRDVDFVINYCTENMSSVTKELFYQVKGWEM